MLATQAGMEPAAQVPPAWRRLLRLLALRRSEESDEGEHYGDAEEDHRGLLVHSPVEQGLTKRSQEEGGNCQDEGQCTLNLRHAPT
jgi:hypothetical protein